MKTADAVSSVYLYHRLPVPAFTCTSLSAETTPKTRAGEGRNGSDKEAGNA